MFIAYINKNFNASSLEVIDWANDIINEYQGQGYDLTLRQLYYQMVARDFIPNNDQSYKRIGSILNDARLAGMVPWTAMVDRTRTVRSNSHWETPRDMMETAVAQYQLDKWYGQSTYVECLIEKDALIGVIAGPCQELDIPYASCRGYTSQSFLWRMAQRVIKRDKEGIETAILHLADHDPSGIDMTRDIKDRLAIFGCEGMIDVVRIGLNYDQVLEHNPPPNYAKISDSRSDSYIEKFGEYSWELDALEPKVISDLITEVAKTYIAHNTWNCRLGTERENRKELERLMGILDKG